MSSQNKSFETSQNDQENKAATKIEFAAAPSISLPEGGGAIRGMGEKFSVNPVTGTGSLSFPIYTSPGRSGFGPHLSLSYDSAAGNGPFGFGWSLALPSITRKTDKGLPKYQDADESDVFILSALEDLVPVRTVAGEIEQLMLTVNSINYSIQRYRPRIEGSFAQIERWTNQDDPMDTFWRSISKDNITTWYGKTGNSRIADPDDPTYIFSWLICESYNDKGNVIVYQYKEEDSTGLDLLQAHEKNRTDQTRSANRYLKSIKYGNRTPYYPILFADQPPVPLPEDWLFEVVFDFGEHDPDTPTPSDPGTWLSRNDPFSLYRAGFEIRTYRICQRVLMFHHFPQEPGVGANCLVHSTDFTYSYEMNPGDTGNPIFSFLRSTEQNGYKRKTDGSYLRQSLPPLMFEYNQATINEEILQVDSESLENLPVGLDDKLYHWVDLDGEGLSGILTEQGNSWFYKPNLSPINVVQENGKKILAARFGPIERIAEKSSLANLITQQFLDLDGNGQLDLVEFQGTRPGFYERTTDQKWEPFRPFSSLPNLDWGDPHLKFIDLTGDGHADLLISEDDVFCWYPSLAQKGFGPQETVRKTLDEEQGPQLVFTDETQLIYLADMSGDGLTDLVRIRNGEVCYWPNRGYGRFGTKVTMDNAPWFDTPDLFNQRRIRLADIDGSGLTDIIYLGRDGVYLYFNQSGNSWGEVRALSPFPDLDQFAEVTVVDLLGNGTACLVWSSPMPGHVRRPMRYVNLMGGQKPHLLVKVINNLGAETRVHYAPSTQFYLEDKLAGKPWITRIPFPVHVVERVETYDWISRNRFITRYAYHHGYFDGIEREFRGFGMVEQWDTEEFAALSDSSDFPAATNLDAASHVPPVLTHTWFHTGAYLEGRHISRQFENEYYRESGLSEEQQKAMLLDDTVLPAGLSAEEEREASRALKGAILRQEVYGLDGTEEQDRPYRVSERNYTIKLLQPRGENNFAVFFTHPRETIDFHYERKLFDTQGSKLADPRVSHTMILEVDNYGNVLQSVAIGYGRRHPDQDPLLTGEDRNKQQRTLVVYTENHYTNPVLVEDAYRTPLPCETRTYELLKVTPEANIPQVTNLFRFEEMRNRVHSASDGMHEIAYEDVDASGAIEEHPYRRLIEHMRSLYRPNDFGAALGDSMDLLALGDLESLALPGESYHLAFTPGLLADIYRRDGENLLPDPITVLQEGGYVRSNEKRVAGHFPSSDPNDYWWIPSGRVFYSLNSTDDAVIEGGNAREHFFMANRYRDPFGSTTTVRYDVPYDLLVLETEDALHNRVTTGERDDAGQITNRNDYRVLQPRLMTDPNGNRSEVAYDTLGMVVGRAVMGKPDEGKGDSMNDFSEDLEPSDLEAFFNNPKGTAATLLGSATTRLIYDVHRFRRTYEQNPTDPDQWQPAFAAMIDRETHVSDLEPNQLSPVQLSFSYSDGFGREIQKKIQAEPGPVVEGGPEVNPRWVGSGWTIFNNKGNPVQKYEPFFDDTHDFRFGKIVGVSSTLFYDPVDRVTATLHPNHTYEKVVFDPWQQATWDVNDTVLVADPKNDPDVGDFFRRLPNGVYLPTWYGQRQDGSMGTQEQSAAQKTAVHASTPTVAYFDTLGRTFLTVAHNRFVRNGSTIEEKYLTRVQLDIEGNQRAVIDALDRIVMRYDYNMLGSRIHQASMEAEERWMLHNVTGQSIRAWDSRGHEFSTEYDELRRPVRAYVIGDDSQQDPTEKILFERTEYGEGQPNDIQLNLRTRVFRQYDGAGVATNEEYDFKGNLLGSSRQLAVDYKDVPDWSTNPLLDPEVFSSTTAYDALNRPIILTTPDDSVIQPRYNEANLLEKVEVYLRGSEEVTTFVENMDYNAKGQRMLIELGNGVRTQYEYDPLTFRLNHLVTSRGEAFLNDCPSPPLSDWPGCGVQNLRYTYDPVGNITHIRDDAQQTVYFQNRRVEPSAEYTYDAVYWLIEATGREHLGQTSGQPNPPKAPDAFNGFHTRLNHPGDGTAMGTYIERYIYDAVGNILSIQHRGSNPVQPGWTRTYAYHETSQLEAGKVNNRLSSTTIGATTETYRYDGSAGLHGNITAMPHLPLMQWDFRDQLRATAQQVVNNGGTPETTWYVYDANGQRVRKVTERQTSELEPKRIKERIYLGGFEIYREYENDGDTVKLERETLHIMDAKQRIVLVETKTQGDDDSPSQLIRYQFSNHLGSASLELDDQAQIISYEEYTPYGSTSYQAVRSLLETPKRYRYTGKERDEENGFYYHGARYYAPWLGRWLNADPIGIGDGVNVYRYVTNNPIRLLDVTGMQGSIVEETKITRIRNGTEEIIKDEKKVIIPEITVVGDPVPALEEIQLISKPEEQELAPSDYNMHEPISAFRTISPIPKYAVRITGPDIDPVPTRLGISPSNPKAVLSPAEHALGEHLITGNGSPFVSASMNPHGAPNIQGSQKLYINIERAVGEGAELISEANLQLDMQRLAESNPTRYSTRAEMWQKAQAAGEREVLFKGSIEPRAVETTGMRSLRYGGRILQVGAVALTAYDMGSATVESVKVGSPRPITAETVRQVGGWGGAWAGAKVGTIVGAALGIETGPGAILIGLGFGAAFGVGGYLGADWVADYIYKN